MKNEYKKEGICNDCIVCMNDIDDKYYMVPCGYTNVCEKCIISIDKCPSYMQNIKIKIKIY